MGRLARQAKRRIRRLRLEWFNRISDRELQSALVEVVPRDCRGLMVHSALGECGYFVGGNAAIISALDELSDTLCMPTHTYCYPAKEGAVPPLFDPRTTRSVVGALTESYWRQPDVLRSIHPSHSVGVRGRMAAELVRNHETCNTPCGDGTPYAKMIAAEFSVVMLGASLNAYTFFHTAEHDAEVPYLYFPRPLELRALDYSSHELQIPTRRQNMTVLRRFAEMDSELEREGLLRRRKIGLGQILCIPNSRLVHEYVCNCLRINPLHLVRQ